MGYINHLQSFNLSEETVTRCNNMTFGDKDLCDPGYVIKVTNALWVDDECSPGKCCINLTYCSVHIQHTEDYYREIEEKCNGGQQCDSSLLAREREIYCRRDDQQSDFVTLSYICIPGECPRNTYIVPEIFRLTIILRHQAGVSQRWLTS